MRGIRCAISGIAFLLPASVCAAPAVALTAPLAETRYLAPAAIELTADPVVDAGRSIERVEFLADGAVIGTATQAPWSFSWTNVAKGNYNLRARVFDNLGARDASPVVRIHVRDNTPPKVRVSAPEHRFIAPGSVPLTAEVTDRDDPIAKVEFFNGETLLATLTAEPYAINWSDVPAGNYEIRARATDSLGAIGTSNLFRVRVRDNAAPHVRILTPDNRDTFPAPAAISISLHANDRDDNLTNVQLFANGAALTTFTAAPFEFNWTNIPPGTYALTALATDDLGLTTTSRTVNVTVTGAPPPAAEPKLYFIHVDHLNTPRLVADEQQRTVWRWDQQEPFGDSVPDQDPSGLGVFAFPLRFGGWQYADEETNRFWNWFRTYSAAHGRYDQSDPLGLRDGPNTYVYGRSNALLYIDALGLDTAGCDGIPNVVEGSCTLRCCARHDECFDRQKCTRKRGNPCHPAQCTTCNTDVMKCFAKCVTNKNHNSDWPKYYCAKEHRYISIPGDYPTQSAAEAACEYDHTKDWWTAHD